MLFSTRNININISHKLLYFIVIFTSIWRLHIMNTMIIILFIIGTLWKIYLQHICEYTYVLATCGDIFYSWIFITFYLVDEIEYMSSGITAEFIYMSYATRDPCEHHIYYCAKMTARLVFTLVVPYFVLKL